MIMYAQWGIYSLLKRGYRQLILTKIERRKICHDENSFINNGCLLLSLQKNVYKVSTGAGKMAGR